LKSAEEYGWEVIPTVDFRASPSATVQDEVIEVFWHELSARIPRGGVDAVFFVLHGAMVTQSLVDVEGEMLARLRDVVGDVPICRVFDLHEHLTQRMADLANCLVAYRENPHTDARAMSLLAAELLQRALTTKQVPKMYWQHPPLMWPPTGTG